MTPFIVPVFSNLSNKNKVETLPHLVFASPQNGRPCCMMRRTTDTDLRGLGSSLDALGPRDLGKIYLIPCASVSLTSRATVDHLQNLHPVVKCSDSKTVRRGDFYI